MVKLSLVFLHFLFFASFCLCFNSVFCVVHHCVRCVLPRDENCVTKTVLFLCGESQEKAFALSEKIRVCSLC